MKNARALVVKGEPAAALAQVREGLKCSSSPNVWASLLGQSFKVVRMMARRRNGRDFVASGGR
jgi:hypothetical protein